VNRTTNFKRERYERVESRQITDKETDEDERSGRLMLTHKGKAVDAEAPQLQTLWEQDGRQ